MILSTRQLDLLLMVLIWGFVSCQDTKHTTASIPESTAATKPTDDYYLPSILSGTALGQDRATVLKNRPQAVRVNSFVETSYEGFTENSDFEDYNTINYDFEHANPHRLVHIRLLHTNINALKATLKTFDGKLIDNNHAIYERVLSDQTSVFAQVTNRSVLYYLKDHQPVLLPTKDR